MAHKSRSEKRVADYLFRHGKKFHLVRAVPRDVQKALGKKLFFQVIHTDSQKAAKEQARIANTLSTLK